MYLINLLLIVGIFMLSSFFTLITREKWRRVTGKQIRCSYLFICFYRLVQSSVVCLLMCFYLAARLDVYIYDYLVKKKLHNTAKSFMTEGKVAPDPVGKG